MGRHGSVDTREITGLLARIEGMRSAAPEFVRGCTNELAQRLLRKVIKRTPVGKKPTFEGKATVKVKGESGKSRTFLTRKKADFDRCWSGYAGGYLRRSWRVSAEQGSGYNCTVKIENPAEYASYVEHGHRQTPGRYVPALGKALKVSWVRGRHMLSDSVNELEDSKYKIIDRKVKDFLKEHMNV